VSYRHSSYRKVKRALVKCEEPNRCGFDGLRLLTAADASRLTPAELERVEVGAWAPVPRHAA
jgi:hypothetical protein